MVACQGGYYGDAFSPRRGVTHDTGWIGARGATWLQGSLNRLVDWFARMGLDASPAKTKAMTYLPHAICGGVSPEF